MVLTYPRKSMKCDYNVAKIKHFEGLLFEADRYIFMNSTLLKFITLVKRTMKRYMFPAPKLFSSLEWNKFTIQTLILEHLIKDLINHVTVPKYITSCKAE